MARASQSPLHSDNEKKKWAVQHPIGYGAPSVDDLLQSEERLRVYTAWLGRTLEGTVNSALWRGDPQLTEFDSRRLGWEIAADTIILSSGGDAQDGLYHALGAATAGLDRAPGLHLIGDAFAPRTLRLAMLDAARLGRALGRRHTGRYRICG